jgi:2-oxo-4-hydroxy-4-carboxy-5-ureidoimidazoline decarboxylase
VTITIAELDAMPAARAATELHACSGARAWVTGMLAHRPFCSRSGLLRAAEDVDSTLSPADWMEAFSHHPRIGERLAAAPVTPAAQDWSAAEQSAASEASHGTARALAEGNALYESRFGFIFIVCASGRTADDILTELRERMHNDPDTELRIAAGEQRKITLLRLQTLVSAAAVSTA